MIAAVEAHWKISEAVYEEPTKDRPTLSRHQRDRIGERLRQMYAELKAEPVCPRLEQVLERLTQPSDKG